MHATPEFGRALRGILGGAAAAVGNSLVLKSGAPRSPLNG